MEISLSDQPILLGKAVPPITDELISPSITSEINSRLAGKLQSSQPACPALSLEGALLTLTPYLAKLAWPDIDHVIKGLYL
jgi:hypothetical protein